MSAEESAESRQESEFSALQSIFENDLRDLRTPAAWNSWTPLNLSITLKPQQGSSGTNEAHVQIDLHVICPRDYPNRLPEIKLENSKGLSNTVLTQLYDELMKVAAPLKGEVMIYQLATRVQEFLLPHNKPSPGSLYDEMVLRNEAIKQKELEAQRHEEERQRQEIQKKQELLKAEFKQRKESRFSENSSEGTVDLLKNSLVNMNLSSTESSEEDTICTHNSSIVIDFGTREIRRGKCLSHKNPNYIIYSGIDVETGEIVQIGEWIITVEDDSETHGIQRQISNLEQELNNLSKLRHHCLAHYQNIKHEVSDNKFIVYVVQEFIYGASCNSLYISKEIKVDIETLKRIAKDVLLALEYLHRNNVVHKNVNDSSIYLSNKGIKVTKYSIHKRLTDLVSHIHVNYGKKTDIYNFGLFLLSLLAGSVVNSENFEIPTYIPFDLHDLLQRCTVKEEKERYTASKLLQHSFFQKPTVTFSPKHQVEIIERDNISPEMPHKDFPRTEGQSRMKSEFDYIEEIGRGAFGKVFKVKNNLDGCYYALKSIKLSPKNKQLYKKIVREVKLLSRLNHENVVRYYNSWIEANCDLDTSSEKVSEESADSNIPRRKRIDELSVSDNIEAMAPPADVEVIYDSKSEAVFSSSADDDVDSFDEDQIFANYESDSDGIHFENTDGEPVPTAESSTYEQIPQPVQVKEVKKVDYMFIQMEFCEKSTLRTAIDTNLYMNESRVSRLFREIVEGLAHIHQQGMIHRDLKPVNIFLDYEDHVKIGDFGLATVIKSRIDEINLRRSPIESDKEIEESKSGVVGTALYVAPEICNSPKAVYSQKVDIYSLGIILFEMCYHPLNTGMERNKVLAGVRSKEIEFPEDFFRKGNEKMHSLIKWLLDHDISKRPTSLELLQSDDLPPPVLEERQLRELVRHTLSNSQSKAYKYLVASCFKQSLTPAQDITYDKEPVSTATKPLQHYDFVRQKIVQIFKQHGGQSLSTPLLMPKNRYYENVELCVRLMTHFGGIVSLPHDLRVPFARYVAWHNIKMFRRYSVERVYREKKVFGCIPRELYECAFDIVTPRPGNLMSDAEILYMVFEIIQEIPGVKNKNFSIRLNHTSLLKAILYHCGIKEKHKEVFCLLSDIQDGKIPTFQMKNYLINLNLNIPDSMLNTFEQLINTEVDMSRVAGSFQVITKKKSGDASKLAKEALQDLKLIAQNAEAFGITFDITVVPKLVYNVEQYSGMICQFVCERSKKHKQATTDVVAAGGRYDSMIEFYRDLMIQEHMLSKEQQPQQAAVGISISLDKLVQIMQKEQGDNPEKLFLDVAICSVGAKSLLKEVAKILKGLWSLKVRGCFIESSNMEEINDQMTELKIAHLIILKDNEQGRVWVRSWQSDRYVERVVNTADLMDTMQKIIKDWKDPSYDNSQSGASIFKSESRVSISEHGSEVNADVLFVTEEKLSANSRKRYDNQVRSQLESLFKRLNGYVIVFGTTLESNVIRTLASHLEFHNENHYQTSLTNVISKHQKQKKYITDVCDEIHEQKKRKGKAIIVVYNLSNNFYKVIV